ncbi:hypothetical protein PsorP6_017876 [Peronosclerospora sorghi]|uniref:Uncharacterized protein n=1 Tax=Peronosclerospora sorghi TaxID=230839 RepID=A0ACC0WC63_9STRA|nr:hypothetical protein PsorP6_017876 [Peronosclerospora sorghi]
MSNDLTELQTQRQVVDLLNAWSLNVAIAETHADVLNPVTLRRAQLAKKQLEGRVDDDYVFGRRFFSVSTYVETLSREELLKTAKDRKIELPQMNKQERSAVKVLGKELVGFHGTAQGCPLKSLTLRQLVTEAKAREVLLDDKKEKKSKRAWVTLLKPLIAGEVRASKIREQEEKMWREKIVQVLELEMRKEQQLRILQLIKAMTQQATKSADENQECTEPEDDDAIMRQEKIKDCKNVYEGSDKARAFLSTLATTLRIPFEHEDIIE